MTKARHVDEVLGGIDRLTFQMMNVLLPHSAMLHSIDLLGTEVGTPRPGRRGGRTRGVLTPRPR